MKQYDYLIVGSGLFGSVFAHEVTKKGKRCLVIDKRKVTGGNVRCETIEGIVCHQYGPHIFHTNEKWIWDYVNSFCEFLQFTYQPVANYRGKLFSLPFNMNTFYQLWGVWDPSDAKQMIGWQRFTGKITNLEEQALSLVGEDVYNTLIKGYTEKQWGRPCHELPASIIKRIPLRFTFDNNYFNDRYQGIPVGGYNKLIEGLLQGIECRTSVDYFSDKGYFDSLADQVVYTGPIDQYFNYCFGELEYRSLRFETEVLNEENYQAAPVVNYTDSETKFTRIIEHKHFERTAAKGTVITREFPEKWNKGREPFYPVNDASNNGLYRKYSEMGKQEENVIFGGRLASYKYYNMDQVIAQSFKQVKNEQGLYRLHQSANEL